MSGQLGLFAPMPASIEGIDPAKAVASYSCDLIGMSNKVRKPVSCGGDLWVNTGGGGTVAHRVYDMYRLVPVEEFDGIPTTYHAKTAMWQDGDEYPGDYARNDPNGFYHGMAVQNGSVRYVLYGPPQKLTINGSVETLDTTEEEEEEEDATEDEEDAVCICGKHISQSDNYYQTDCGLFCEECMETHAENCPNCTI